MAEIADQVKAAEREWLELFARGPDPGRWPEVPLAAGDRAPDLTLEDTDGKRVTLAELWAERPALIMFWRHFGCGCGFDRAKRLTEEHGAYVEADAEVTIIGQGEPERASAYAREHGIGCRVLCDPDYAAYRAYGLSEGEVARILYDAPTEFWSHPRELGERFQAQRRSEGRPPVDHPWLMPGEFVVDTSGILRLAYRYQYCEDFPDPRVLITAVREAA